MSIVLQFSWRLAIEMEVGIGPLWLGMVFTMYSVA